MPSIKTCSLRIILLFSLLFNDAFAQNTSYQNMEQPCSAIKNYKNNSDALANKPENYFFRLLDGDWFYKTYPDGSKNNYTYLTSNFSGAGFNKLNRSTTPEMLSQESVSVYFTTFTTPQTWDFREIFIKIAPNYSAYRLYVNAQKAGECLDTKTEAVFDITKIAKEGENSLVIECFNQETSETLESRSFPKNGGLSSVYLFSTPKVRLMDYRIITSFSEEMKNGSLNLNLTLKTHLLNSKTVDIKAEIYDLENNRLATNSESVSIDLQKQKEISLHFNIADAKRYSSHSPFLYKAVVTLSQENRITECIKIDFGFKTLSIDNKSIQLNQTPLRFYGLTYYGSETIESDGQYTNRVRKELKAIKEIGFNSIRLKNTPQRAIFYTICDSVGLYVFDQSNLNLRSSGYDKSVGGTVAAAPLWNPLISERATGQFHKTKNNPSVIALNIMANGSNGYNLYESFLAIKNSGIPSILWTVDNNRDWNNDLLFFSTVEQSQALSWDPRPTFLEITSGLSDNLLAIKRAIELTNSPNNLSGFFVDAPYKVITEHREELKQLLESFSIEPIDLTNGEVRVLVKNNKIPLSDLKIKQTLLKNGIPIGDQFTALTNPVKNEIRIDYGSFDGIKDRQSVFKSKDYSIKLSIVSPTSVLYEREFKLSSNSN